jgi:hypothetical protein
MAAAAVGGRIVGRRRVREAGIFLRERQQRISLGAAYGPTRVLAEEENYKRENQTKTDRESEWDDRHDARRGAPAVLICSESRLAACAAFRRAGFRFAWQECGITEQR